MIFCIVSELTADYFDCAKCGNSKRALNKDKTNNKASNTTNANANDSNIICERCSSISQSILVTAGSENHITSTSTSASSSISNSSIINRSGKAENNTISIHTTIENNNGANITIESVQCAYEPNGKDGSDVVTITDVFASDPPPTTTITSTSVNVSNGRESDACAKTVTHSFSHCKRDSSIDGEDNNDANAKTVRPEDRTDVDVGCHHQDSVVLTVATETALSWGRTTNGADSSIQPPIGHVGQNVSEQLKFHLTSAAAADHQASAIAEATDNYFDSADRKDFKTGFVAWNRESRTNFSPSKGPSLKRKCGVHPNNDSSKAQAPCHNRDKFHYTRIASPHSVEANSQPSNLLDEKSNRRSCCCYRSDFSAVHGDKCKKWRAGTANGEHLPQRECELIHPSDSGLDVQVTLNSRIVRSPNENQLSIEENQLVADRRGNYANCDSDFEKGFDVSGESVVNQCYEDTSDKRTSANDNEQSASAKRECNTNSKSSTVSANVTTESLPPTVTSPNSDHFEASNRLRRLEERFKDLSTLKKTQRDPSVFDGCPFVPPTTPEPLSIDKANSGQTEQKPSVESTEPAAALKVAAERLDGELSEEETDNNNSVVDLSRRRPKLAIDPFVNTDISSAVPSDTVCEQSNHSHLSCDSGAALKGCDNHASTQGPNRKADNSYIPGCSINEIPFGEPVQRNAVDNNGVVLRVNQHKGHPASTIHPIDCDKSTSVNEPNEGHLVAAIDASANATQNGSSSLKKALLQQPISTKESKQGHTCVGVVTQRCKCSCECSTNQRSQANYNDTFVLAHCDINNGPAATQSEGKSFEKKVQSTDPNGNNSPTSDSEFGVLLKDTNQNPTDRIKKPSTDKTDEILSGDLHTNCEFDVRHLPDYSADFGHVFECYDELEWESSADEEEEPEELAEPDDDNGNENDNDSDSVCECTIETIVPLYRPYAIMRETATSGTLRGLLKKPNRPPPARKNRVVFDEGRNEFFDADYIILIRDDCPYDEEDEEPCTCGEHELVRLCCEEGCQCTAYSEDNRTPQVIYYISLNICE